MELYPKSDLGKPENLPQYTAPSEAPYTSSVSFSHPQKYTLPTTNPIPTFPDFNPASSLAPSLSQPSSTPLASPYSRPAPIPVNAPVSSPPTAQFPPYGAPYGTAPAVTATPPPATQAAPAADVGQLLRQQEQHFQTTMMLNKIQEQFSRIVMYMENMDNRLSRLESVTRDILDNSRKAPSEPISSSSIRPNPSPSPAASYREPPSDSFKASSPAYVDKDFQEDQDAALARKLQLKEERRARKAERQAASSSSSQSRPPPPPVRDALEECPLCQGKFPASVIQVHAEQCLEKLSPAQQEEKKKAGFFEGWFTKKKPEEKKPAAPTEVRMAPGTYFPQQPYIMPYGQPGFLPGTTMPPGAQIVYYNPQTQQK